MRSNQRYKSINPCKPFIYLLFISTIVQLLIRTMKGLRRNEATSGHYSWYQKNGLIFLLLICFCNYHAEAQQVCSGSLGDPVINQTFGTNHYQLPPNHTTYQPVGGCPNDAGTYTISGFLFGCGPRSWVQMVGDHTPNDLNGNYMLVNASNTPGTVYTDTAKNICGNTVYQFGVWVTSVMTKYACGGTPVLPKLKFKVTNLSGGTLAEDSTAYLQIVEESHWQFYGFSLRTPANVTNVIISITTDPSYGCGAAFAIDDVTFTPCSPSTITATINGTAGPVDVCADYTDVWLLNATYTPGFNDPVFQWQNSLDSGKTWVDIPGATALSYTVPHRRSGTIWYRICIAERGNINSASCRVTSNIIQTGVHPLPDPVPPQNVKGCIGKDFYFPSADQSALQFFWTGPNGYSYTQQVAVIQNVQYKDTGMYRVKQTFTYGCVSFDTFYLKVFPGTSITVQPPYPICEGKSERLFASATDTVSYKWTPSISLSNDTVANPLATPQDSTQYKVLVTNKYGCQDSAYLQLNVYRNAAVNAGPDKSILIGDTAILNGSLKGTALEYYWTPAVNISNSGITNPQAFPLETTNYTLHAISTVGCGSASDDVQVFVYNDLYIPNAFTPNADGKNDKFQIIILDNYKIITFAVFNRWGQTVFKSNGTTNSWDGTFHGKIQPQGTYVYRVEIQATNGKKIIKQGTVFLMR